MLGEWFSYRYGRHVGADQERRRRQTKTRLDQDDVVRARAIFALCVFCVFIVLLVALIN